MVIKMMFNVLCLTFLLSCSTSSNSQVADDAVEKEAQESYLITPEQLRLKIEEQELVIIDVRTPDEVADGVIEEAMVINYRDEGFKEQLLSLDKLKVYVVYCKSGGRSGQTKVLMDANGFGTVYDLKGGITAWKAEGFSVY